MLNNISNWGKWGPDDQRGTFDYFTPEKIRRSAQLVKTGMGSPITPLAIT